MDLRQLAPWPIAPLSFERAELGRNNDSFFVDAREGRYVLRIYRNATEPARVRDEHDLLARLALAELPFATPLPLETRVGDTLAVLETVDGPRFAALFPRIPGEPVELDAANARLAGAALARVDAAFARFDLPVRAPASLRDVHDLVPDPYAAMEELDLGEGAEPVRRLFARVDGAHDALVASLPRQIVHGDFAFPNLLVEDGKVSGLVDFEFSGSDFRAADLACALYIVTVRAQAAERWKVLEALANGYRRVLPLDPIEVAAMPELMVRRSAIGLVHWIGRWRAGIAERNEPLERIERGGFLVAWIDENAARLALTVAGARPPGIAAPPRRRNPPPT
jgi:homoserine kinase type II